MTIFIESLAGCGCSPINYVSEEIHMAHLIALIERQTFLSYSVLFLSNERTVFAHVTHLIKVISPLACDMKFISIFYWCCHGGGMTF